MTERRMARRFDLSLPVAVRSSAYPQLRSYSGETREISTRGMYFTMQKDLAPGMELELTLTLPAEITWGTKVFIRAHGRVVRVDGNGDRVSDVGVAAVIERYDVIRDEAS